MTEYETTLIFRPDLSSQNIDDTLGHLRNVVGQEGGKFLEINHWGKRKLAYDIQKFSRGIYVHTLFLGKNDLVAEVERNLRISDKILRFLTIKTAMDVDPASRQEKAYEGLKDELIEDVREKPASRAEAAPEKEAPVKAEAAPEKEAPVKAEAAPEKEAPVKAAAAPQAEAAPQENAPAEAAAAPQAEAAPQVEAAPQAEASDTEEPAS